MSAKNKKQFGVWMDNHRTTVIGYQNDAATDFTVLGHAENAGPGGNSNEHAANNLEKTLLAKFFKSITSHMPNADEVHVTGTGTIQEQFIRYLGETPQYKNTATQHSTSNKMSDEKLVEYVSARFN